MAQDVDLPGNGKHELKLNISIKKRFMFFTILSVCSCCHCVFSSSISLHIILPATAQIMMDSYSTHCSNKLLVWINLSFQNGKVKWFTLCIDFQIWFWVVDFKTFGWCCCYITQSYLVNIVFIQYCNSLFITLLDSAIPLMVGVLSQ